MTDSDRRRWKYEPDEKPKKKHGWHRDEAGFVEVNGVLVSKCPKGMSNEEAEALLNDGIAIGNDDAPEKIYGIREGVLYRAMPTNPGSYHGFPEHPRYFRRLPRKTRDQVFEYARQRGMEQALEEWLDQ